MIRNQAQAIAANDAAQAAVAVNVIATGWSSVMHAMPAMKPDMCKRTFGFEGLASRENHLGWYSLSRTESSRLTAACWQTASAVASQAGQKG